MQDERLIVKYIPVKTCFVNLPEQWLKKVSSRANVVKVVHNDVNYYLSWYTRPSADTRLAFSATFARSLNIKEGDEVFVSCVDEAPTLTSIAVAPKTAHDREILELQYENVQLNLLDQIAIVAENQTIVAWISKFLSVTLIVRSMNPGYKYGRLGYLTEIHVDDMPALKVKPDPSDCGRVANLLEKLELSTEIPISSVHRAVPLANTDEPFHVYASRSHLPMLGDAGSKICTLRKHWEDRQRERLSRLTRKAAEFTVLVSPLEDSASLVNNLTTFPLHHSLFVPESLLEDLEVRVGAPLILEYNSSNISNPKCTAVELTPLEVGAVSVEAFRAHVARCGRLLLSSGGTLVVEGNVRCKVKLIPDSCSYVFLDQNKLYGIGIWMQEMLASETPPEPVEELEDVPNQTTVLEVLDSIITECKSVLQLSLGLHNVPNFEYDRENILICGYAGSGKTTICKLLRKFFDNGPYFTYTRFIDCRALKGKKVEPIQKLLNTELSQAVYYQPTILFLDNIESITSASSSTDENTPDAMNSARISDAIYNTISSCQATNYISLVCTCTDISKVGKKLRVASGTHFFRTILTIPTLEKEQRIQILRSRLQDKLYVSKEINWDYYGNKTEGWIALDLVVLANKAAFVAWKRQVEDKLAGAPMLVDDDLNFSLEQSVPHKLRGVTLYQRNGLAWSDIGGLASVKLALLEMLDWPLRYPEIFKHAPIKMQNGVLLYGMPGTGKTMIAASLVREFSLNLISVKGPELLSKYIGASEEAVRNIFEKAKRAKPCVLFFDEFESLAPRRGHDRTGVTDRVVNQLLTHLDGIEGREGVAVVAASSRPDLLDPALLRPGRFDKFLLCSLPDQDEREEILDSRCRVHGINSQDLDLSHVAKLTTGYTGADLNAVLMQARLSVIDKALEESSVVNQQNVNDIKITQEDLIQSVNATKPSLVLAEKEKYNRIYTKFAKSEGYSIDGLMQQKTTLA